MKTRGLLGGAAIGVMASMLGAGAALAADGATLEEGGVTLQFGGFIAAETVMRSKAEEADIGSTFSGIPFANSSVGRTEETRFTARQSRLSLLAKGDIDPDTHIAFYQEYDFLGGAQTANSNESNSYNLRIRNIYSTIDWDNLGLHALAGQSWSLVTMNTKGITPRNEDVPLTIEAQYAVGFNWARQPQFRLVKDFDKVFWIGVSAENPQTTIASPAPTATGVTPVDVAAGGSEFDKANNLSLNHIPDFVAKAAFEPFFGDTQPLHVEVYGLLRSFYDRTDVAKGNLGGYPVANMNNDVSGGGIGGGITYSVLPSLLDLQASALEGKGIGRYGSGQLPDITLQPDGKPAPIQETEYLLGGTLHLLGSLDIYSYYGQETDDAKAYTLTVAGKKSYYGYGNPGFSTAGCFVEGGTCSVNIQQETQYDIGAWWKFYQGSFGSARFGVQYSHTELGAFAGVGGKPTTSDDMFFTSLRYYPGF